jgi:hypothetical protein
MAGSSDRERREQQQRGGDAGHEAGQSHAARLTRLRAAHTSQFFHSLSHHAAGL